MRCAAVFDARLAATMSGAGAGAAITAAGAGSGVGSEAEGCPKMLEERCHLGEFYLSIEGYHSSELVIVDGASGLEKARVMPR
jgi:hypothetical protein